MLLTLVIVGWNQLSENIGLPMEGVFFFLPLEAFQQRLQWWWGFAVVLGKETSCGRRLRFPSAQPESGLP